jgi:SpoVK/Ycf46/Vps4 family AAA+-type ATPase
MDNIIKATRGLASFATEQVTALSMSKEGVNVSKLWGYKQKMIESSKGLTLLQPKETFDDIGGIEQAKFFGNRIFKGQAAPSTVVFMDEIEKMMAGSGGGDLSGVSQDFLGVILSAMEDNAWTGLIAVGPPGCAKSFYAKTLGATHDVPVLQFDMGALKGSLVGQSETQMRDCIKTIEAVAGDGAFFVATCNKLDSLPPELRRRFRLGIWYFDLPEEKERNIIWDICRKKFSINEKDKCPKSVDWTGADIRNCCEVAWRLGLSLVEAAQFITPVSQSDPESIAKLRKMADSRFLSASHPGTYKHSQPKQSSGKRKIDVSMN